MTPAERLVLHRFVRGDIETVAEWRDGRWQTPDGGPLPFDPRGSKYLGTIGRSLAVSAHQMARRRVVVTEGDQQWVRWEDVA